MKLLMCLKCSDVFSLRQVERTCVCGLSSGKYLKDELNATYAGPCVPLVFDNMSLDEALRNQPRKGPGKEFKAVVVPIQCSTMRKTDPDPEK